MTNHAYGMGHFEPFEDSAKKKNRKTGADRHTFGAEQRWGLDPLAPLHQTLDVLHHDGLHLWSEEGMNVFLATQFHPWTNPDTVTKNNLIQQSSNSSWRCVIGQWPHRQRPCCGIEWQKLQWTGFWTEFLEWFQKLLKILTVFAEYFDRLLQKKSDRDFETLIWRFGAIGLFHELCQK